MKATLTPKETKELTQQRELVANFQHIKGLKAGDVLRYTKEGRYRYPAKGSLIVVYSVLPEIEKENSCSRRVENDFTALIQDPDDNEIMEFAYDSRFFEKVKVE